MEVKRTIKTDVESFERGDVISFKLKDGEKVQAKAVKKTEYVHPYTKCKGRGTKVIHEYEKGGHSNGSL